MYILTASIQLAKSIDKKTILRPIVLYYVITGPFITTLNISQHGNALHFKWNNEVNSYYVQLSLPSSAEADVQYLTTVNESSYNVTLRNTSYKITLSVRPQMTPNFTFAVG